MKICKYRLGQPMPKGARILRVDLQDGEPRVWALVDQSAPLERRLLHIYETGHEIQNVERLTYLGTYFDGPYVWHAFEEKEV